MIDAMKKGLEALQGSGYYDTTQQREAITALRQAIAEAEKQELVPEQWMGITDNPYCNDIDCNDPNGRAMRWHNKLLDLRKQEHAAPPKREWVGLAWEEIRDIWIANYHDTNATDAFAYAIEAKLKERNT
jgi:hypothetical protein